MDIYESLLKGSSELKNSSEETSGMDGFLSGDVIKVSSLDEICSFVRIGSDVLVHKAEKDLWRIGEDEKGQIVIERLFDPNTKEALKV